MSRHLIIAYIDDLEDRIGHLQRELIQYRQSYGRQQQQLVEQDKEIVDLQRRLNETRTVGGPG